MDTLHLLSDDQQYCSLCGITAKHIAENRSEAFVSDMKEFRAVVGNFQKYGYASCVVLRKVDD